MCDLLLMARKNCCIENHLFGHRMSASWEDFVAGNIRLVADAALRVTAHVADAEDITQEVFLEIFKSNQLGKFATQPALLHTLATRRALDRLRRRRATEQLHDDHMLSREGVPSEMVEAAELDDRLRESLSRLPPRQAEVFCLVYFENMSSCDVATVLGISRSAVAKALCLARRQLSLSLSINSAEPLP